MATARPIVPIIHLAVRAAQTIARQNANITVPELAMMAVMAAAITHAAGHALMQVEDLHVQVVQQLALIVAILLAHVHVAAIVNPHVCMVLNKHYE